MAHALPTAPPAAGWHARLALRFERRGAGTRLVSNRHHGPLRLIRALAGEDGSCHAVLVHPPGGLVGGDTLDIDVGLGEAARVLCTTPGAQKWYRSSGATSRSATRLQVGPGATLEWLPQPAIVYDAARAEQHVSFELDESARLIGWECLVLGRAAMGERFLHGHLRQHLSVRVGGQLVWAERMAAAAGERLFASPLGWGGRTVAATVWAAGPAPESLLAQWRDALAVFEAAPGGLAAGATRPAPGLLVARVLADDAEAAMNAVQALWRLARPALAGSAAPPPRIWAT